MKGQRILTSVLVLVLALSLAVGLSRAEGPTPSQPSPWQGEGTVGVGLAPLGTSFTYQGQLKQGGNPVNGTCDFQFGLWNAASGGTQIGTTQTKTNISVTNGLLTIPDLDFGGGALSGDARWLAIALRCPAGSGSYSTLDPRQALTPAPYALALPGLWTQPNATSPNLIGGYSSNSVTAGLYGATIGGGGSSGSTNRVTDNYGTVGGGENNQAGDAAGTTSDRPYATVGGGQGNTASGWATVGGGYHNTASGNYNATVGGGTRNTASGNAATVGGGDTNTASGPGAFVGGGGWDGTTVSGNQARGQASTIGGGFGNVITTTAAFATVGGGWFNEAGGYGATVGGGQGNTASGAEATVGGGGLNIASDYATVGGGHENTASNYDATVGGGTRNTASGGAATVGGGEGNTASGFAATIPGGDTNTAQGDYSFATGYRAKANNQGCFVWGDSTDADIECSVDNRWVARASGGVYFYTNSALTTGSYLPAGGTSWNAISDRATKENFTPVDSGAILEKLAAMPVQEYNLKSQDPALRHIGPVAQDFSAAFGYGESDKAINMEDADGVALAAIQGLYQLVQEKDTQIAALKAKSTTQQQQITALQQQNAALEARLSALEQAVGASCPSQSSLPSGWLLLSGLAVAAVLVGQRRFAGGGR